jgi:hypothetical protein
VDKKVFIDYVKKDIPNTYYDSSIWEEDGKTHITIVIRTDPENLASWKEKLIKEFDLEDTIFTLVKVVYPKQSWEERDRLMEMSHSDAGPGL